METVISSKDNPALKYAAGLLSTKGREKTGRFLVEGRKLVAEALRFPELIEKIFAVEGYNLNALSSISNYHGDIIRITERLGKIIADTESPQGVWAVCRQPGWGDLFARSEKNDLLLYLDEVQDPGNLGTIMRTAWAMGAGGVILSPGTVDPFNPKVIRAAMGATFHLPVFWDVDAAGIRRLKGMNYQVVALQAPAPVKLYDAEFKDKAVVIMGNEARGISPSLRNSADITVEIPLNPGVDSLNVAVAGSMVIYEWQRRQQFSP